MAAEGNGEANTDQRERALVDYSPTRSRRAVLLYIVDNLLSAIVVGPLVVFYWRGTWELLNVYLFPGDQAASGWTCSAIGNVGLVCLVYLQEPLARWLRLDNKLHWMFGYHLYTYVMGALNVCHWRGVWVLLDHYTGISVLSSWLTFAIGKAITSYYSYVTLLCDHFLQIQTKFQCQIYIV